MTQQFLESGVPLFKASGVPAMDPNCCCDTSVCDFCGTVGSLGTWNYLRLYLEWDSDTIGFGCPFWNGLVYFGFIDTLAEGTPPDCEWTSLPIPCEDFLELFPNIVINYDSSGFLTITMNLGVGDTVSGTPHQMCPPTTGVFYDAALGVTITMEFMTF